MANLETEHLLNEESKVLRIASPEKIKVKAAKLAKQKVLDKFYPRYKEMLYLS